ncbi:alpha/beta hydrolase family protein [Cryptosporangium minutisporangium]|uniref:alpha/beta hydrolase family protein n=1 Tax=Cryptosporangium minutisporangium TaxID=113569 RepID=UPI0031E992DA
MSDPLITDPPTDALPPAATVPFPVPSAGLELLGVLHRPAGPGPHPVVVLLHGFPGNERNFDLAHAIRRAGYATLVFHYRGAWGSPGAFSWGNARQDAAAAVAALRDPDVVAEHGLDPARIALAGHSMGGFVALHTAATDPGIGAVASLAGFDFGIAAAEARSDPAARAAYVEDWAGALGPLAGTSSEALVDEMVAAPDEWRLTTLGPALAGRPVLLGAGSLDDVSPPDAHHDPLCDAYAEARLTSHVWPSDHALADHRVALARALITFLEDAL